MADESIQVTAGEPRWSGDGSRVFVPVLVGGERQSELELEWDGSEFAPVVAAGFDESKHPREEAGGPSGGRFAIVKTKHGGGEATVVSRHETKQQAGRAMKKADKELRPLGYSLKVTDKVGQVEAALDSAQKNDEQAARLHAEGNHDHASDYEAAAERSRNRAAELRQQLQASALDGEETDTDAENRARQADELCPYCNGTGRKGEHAMAASAYAAAVDRSAFSADGGWGSVLVGEPGFQSGGVSSEVLTAAAAGLVPDVPPLSWFEMREPDGPTPLTITADGQVYGHAALWNTCHTGQPGRCTTAPRSQSGYRFFHLGGVETEEGVTVATGKITFGAGHAPLTASRAGTASHYDNSAHAGADVVARDGRHGIWVTGALRPDLPAKVVRTLRAAALSGDWRSVNGSLELIGLLAVNVPGFPVPRAQAALAASGKVDEDAVEALVAAGVMLPVEECEPCVEEELDELLALVAAADPLDELLAPVAIDNLLVDVGAASPQLAYAGPESTVPVVLDSQSAEDVRRRTRMQAARMVGNEPLAMALENAPDAVFESDSGKTVSVTVNIASAE